MYMCMYVYVERICCSSGQEREREREGGREGGREARLQRRERAAADRVVFRVRCALRRARRRLQRTDACSLARFPHCGACGPSLARVGGRLSP